MTRYPAPPIQMLLDMNATRSAEFEAHIADRRLHRKNYPSEFAAIMCMDGRVNWNAFTELPFGLVNPFRNVGGKFNLGWPLMARTLTSWEEYAYSQRRHAVLIVTYHWSAGNTHRGCRGFNYNCDHARDYALRFRDEVNGAFSERIWPIVVGMETDKEYLVVHGEHGEELNMRTVGDVDEAFLYLHLRKICPSLPEQVIADFVPMLMGNVRHIEKIEQLNRNVVEFEHCEWVLALGKGFDWIDRPNLALIVGPCDPALDTPVVTAARILHQNWSEHRISHGGVLLVSTPYFEPRNRKIAAVESRYLAKFALDNILASAPELDGFFTPVVGVIDPNSRRFEVLLD